MAVQGIQKINEGKYWAISDGGHMCCVCLQGGVGGVDKLSVLLSQWRTHTKLKKHTLGFKDSYLGVSKNSTQVPGCVGERAAEDSGDVRRSLHYECRHCSEGFKGKRCPFASGSLTSCAANKQECGAGHWGETFIVKQVRRVSKGRVISCVAHIYIVFSWDYTLSVWHMNWCGYRVARILSGQRGDLEGKQTKHLKLTVVQGSETRGLIKGLHLQSLLYTFITVMACHLGKCAFLPPKRCPSLCYSCDTCLSVS